jgi:hypothetical protein
MQGFERGASLSKFGLFEKISESHVGIFTTII